MSFATVTEQQEAKRILKGALSLYLHPKARDSLNHLDTQIVSVSNKQLTLNMETNTKPNHSDFDVCYERSTHKTKTNYKLVIAIIQFPVEAFVLRENIIGEPIAVALFTPYLSS